MLVWKASDMTNFYILNKDKDASGAKRKTKKMTALI
jgi:hypothetical protein